MQRLRWITLGACLGIGLMGLMGLAGYHNKQNAMAERQNVFLHQSVLRDYLAGQALAGLLGKMQTSIWQVDANAKLAWQYADAMLQYRDR